MAIWVGGDEQIFNRHKSVLDAMGDQAAYIGPIGAGTIAKLVHNCTSAVVAATLAEVFTMGVKAGVDPVDLARRQIPARQTRPRRFGIAPLTQGCRARRRPRAHRRRARGPQALANLCDRFGAATAFPVPDIRDTPDRSWYRRQCRGQPRLI
jgi:hypothetical protein